MGVVEAIESPHETTDRVMRRPRGRPRRSRTDLFRTLVMIESWRRLALWLAQQAKSAVPEAKFGALMVREKVPAALWGKMRTAIGRHLHCLDAPGLTAMQGRGLAMLTRYLDGKPREQWDQKDRRRDEKREQLMARLYGRAVVRRINSSTPGGTSAWPGGKLLPKAKTPKMMRDLWGTFDRWGAGRHGGITLKTFRNLRAALQRDAPELFALLPATPPAQRRPRKPRSLRR
jgi:hypothetical protein